MLLVTFSSTRPGQGSLASRMRGWKDDAAGLEQRLKDLETIARSLRRRWWLVGFGLALGIIGWGFGVVHARPGTMVRSEEHTSELQSQSNLVCRLLLEKKNN